MIAHIRGIILKKTGKGVIIETGNIGYLVHLANSELIETEENQEKSFFIHSHIKEDIFDLYGFESFKNLEFFKQLISVSGIGPKVALEVLNSPSEKIKLAIINEDEVFICETPGIGKKTAKRLILELKDKIEIENIEERQYKNINEEIHDDAVTALIKLGYQKHEIIQTIKNLPEEITKAEEIITFFLKNA